MTDNTTADDRRLTRRQRAVVSLVAVVCILLAGTALVVAQGTGYSEDWESGNLDGYTVSSDASTFSEVNSDNPSEGTYSLYQQIENSSIEDNTATRATLMGDSAINFSDGAVLEYDLDADVSVTFGGGDAADTAFTEARIIGGAGDDLSMRFGARMSDASSGGFRMQGSAVGDPSGPGSGEAVDTNGYSTVELVYVESSQEMELYVDDTLESTQGFNGFEDTENATVRYRTQITADPGSGGTGSAHVNYDDVQAEGIEPTDPPLEADGLRLDARGFLHHGTESPYAVEANQSGAWTDVTDAASVSSGNADAIAVNEDDNVLNATANESINERVTITAQHDGLTTTTNVTVATPTVDNLPILPTWWKVNAVLSDWTFVWILVATMGAVAAATFATPFAGLGGGVMVLLMGWFVGDVPHGLMVASFYMAVFLGLNVAANIDYSVQPQ